MKKAIQKWGGRIALVVCLAFGFNMVADAQVPSIPRKQQTTKRKSTTTRSATNVAWGTQYDWLSTRYVTYSDIQYMDAGQVRVLKTSIYARHGRKFNDSELQEYFNGKSWYNGTIAPENFNADAILSDIEQANLKLIHKYE